MRSWVDEEKVTRYFAKVGLPAADRFVKKLISPAQAEKALKAASLPSELPAALVKKESSGTTLAKDSDPLATLDRIRQPVRRHIHVSHHTRIGHQRLDRRIEKNTDIVRRDASRSQHATEQFREIVTLSDRQCRVGILPLEPLAPGEAPRRLVNPEERRAFIRLERASCQTH
jgi:hypothetical protein